MAVTLNALKLRRLLAGIKQHELADYIGVAESTLSKIETGRRKPTPDETKKLAKKLGCRPEKLLDIDDICLP